MGMASGQQRTALVSVIAAAFLVALKLVTGIASGSLGLVAEALHSGTDLVAALLTLFALRVAVRPPDRDHPVGARQGRAPGGAGRGRLPRAGERVHRRPVAAPADLRRRRRRRRGLVGPGGARRRDRGRPGRARRCRCARRAATRARRWRRTRCTSGPTCSARSPCSAACWRCAPATPAATRWRRCSSPCLVIAAAYRLVRGNVEVLMDRAPEAAAEAARQAIARAEPSVELRSLRVREAAGAYFVEVVVGVPTDAAVGQGHARRRRGRGRRAARAAALGRGRARRARPAPAARSASA